MIKATKRTKSAWPAGGYPSDERVLPVGLKNRSIGTGTIVSQSECDGDKNGHLTPTPGFTREVEKGFPPAVLPVRSGKPQSQGLNGFNSENLNRVLR